MLFSHDTEATLRAACVLVNSDRVDGEELGDQAALSRYLSEQGWTGRRDHDAAELAAVHRLRARLGRIWSAASHEGDPVDRAGVDGDGVDERTVQWLTTAFMLTMAVVIPITGWLLERIPTRTAFILAMSLFTAGTMGCAIAPAFRRRSPSMRRS